MKLLSPSPPLNGPPIFFPLCAVMTSGCVSRGDGGSRSPFSGLFSFEPPQSRSRCSGPIRNTEGGLSFCSLLLPVCLLPRVQNHLCCSLEALYLLCCVIFFIGAFIYLFIFPSAVLNELPGTLTASNTGAN